MTHPASHQTPSSQPLNAATITARTYYGFGTRPADVVKGPFSHACRCTPGWSIRDGIYLKYLHAACPEHARVQPLTTPAG